MPKIEKLYAFVAEDAGPDDEGVTAFLSTTGTWVPMVGADREMVDSLRQMAQHIAFTSGKPIHLLEFSVRTDLEVIQPIPTVVGDYAFSGGRDVTVVERKARG